MEGVSEHVARRASVLANHFRHFPTSPSQYTLERLPCIQYVSPEANSGKPAFDVATMRQILDGHDIELREKIYDIMRKCELFHLKSVGDQLFLQENFGAPLDTQRENTMQRILALRDEGLFKGSLIDQSPQGRLRFAAVFECMDLYDHSLTVKAGVHFQLWGGSLRFLGSKRHHDKWLKATEEFEVRGCFAMTELGHGSNVRGIETVTTYDAATQEFVINTPCESAQKYWIGGAAKHATHTIVFSQLYINGKSEGVHAFVCQIRKPNGEVSPGVKLADCGLKIGLNGVDNGRIWFDHVRVPRENLLNSVSDVTVDGRYESAIKNPDQRFGAFMAPLTSGRVTISGSGVAQSKVVLATAIRYALSRRAFSITDNEPEVLLLDYPSHQHRLLTLLAKTYVYNFATLKLKNIFVVRKPADAKTIHVLSSGLKALNTWHLMRSAQECREACGGQGLKSENKVGKVRSEYDVAVTFEGDNNVLMQQVSKALLADYISSLKSNKPIKSVGLEHMNKPRLVVPEKLERSALRNAQFQLALFQLLERDLVERLANDFQRRISNGKSPTEAANESYQLGGILGKAFSEKQALQAHIETQTENGPIKEILDLLRSLYVLSVVDETPAFLRYGLLTPAHSQIIHAEVAMLCTEIRPYALDLVNSFGIPFEMLGPIASDWIEYNSLKHVLT